MFGEERRLRIIRDGCNAPGGHSASAHGASRHSASGHSDGAPVAATSIQRELASLEAGLTALARIEASDVIDDAALADAALGLERLRRLLDSASCRIMGELDARAVTDRDHGLRTGTWLAREAGLPSGVAKARIRTATKLSTVLPKVCDALAEGRIGFEHARVIADAANSRIEDQMNELADLIVDGTKGVGFDLWRRQTRALADLLDQDGGHDPAGDVERNRLRLSRTGHTLLLNGELCGENALIADQALNAIADELFKKYTRDNELCPELEIPNRPTLLALAFIEAARRGLNNGTTGKAPRPEATLILTPEPGCCGGSGHIRESADTIGESRCGDGHSTSDPPNTLSALVGELADAHNGKWRGMNVTDAAGTPLPERCWETLLCDPDLFTVVTDTMGVPLDLGSTARLASRAQRRAMAARDGGCVFPGCETSPSWTDAHHVKYWENGGPTDVSNMTLLCRYHHGVAHRTGWSLELNPDGTTTWTSPLGQRFPGQQHHRQRPGRADPTSPWATGWETTESSDKAEFGTGLPDTG